jgi:hypothetical protein
LHALLLLLLLLQSCARHPRSTQHLHKLARWRHANLCKGSLLALQLLLQALLLRQMLLLQEAQCTLPTLRLLLLLLLLLTCYESCQCCRALQLL